MSPPSSSIDEGPQALTLQEMVALLIKHHGLHEGLWDLALEMQVGIGQFGAAVEKALPGAVIGISRIGLAKSDRVGPHTVDAAKINPA